MYFNNYTPEQQLTVISFSNKSEAPQVQPLVAHHTISTTSNTREMFWFARLLFIGIVCLCINGCEIFHILSGGSPSSEIIKDLDLTTNWSGNLFGQTVVDGTVKNRRSRTVSGIRLRAIVFDKSGTIIESKEFDLSVGLTYKGEATFSEKMSTSRKYVGDVRVEIINARD